MIIVIIEIEISEVGIIADVTVYLGKKTKPKTNKQTKNKKNWKETHTVTFIPTSSFRRAVLPYVFALEVKFVNQQHKY